MGQSAYDQIKQTADQFKNQVIFEAGIKEYKEAEVFYFPQMNHRPMLRLDLGELNYNQAQAIESSHPNLMLRLSGFGFNPIDENWDHFLARIDQVPDFLPEADEATVRLAVLVRNLAERSGLPIADWVLWEIEVEDDEITARFMYRESNPPLRAAETIERINFEFVPQVSVREGKALLKALDIAKEQRIPYLQYLRQTFDKIQF
ncbi:MAG: hypothetical protein ABIG32_02245 [Candidatus Uhrbacteria bacterium]|nr:hypothetical protein [Patescibacteria group bacterium]MBU1906944.1 hypothetical protein [Patescibacteria group bacterium]